MHDSELDASKQGRLGGGWLGTHAYKGALQAQPPMRFEATLTEPGDGGSFTGTILDDAESGDADVRGEQSGQGIRFTKEYRQSRMPLISYEGTLAEDGRTISGTWQIEQKFYGVWDARRVWSDSGLSAEQEAVEEAQEEWDKPRVREVVRLE